MNLHTAYFALYIIVPIAGVALNGYVLWRLLKVARKSAIRFETSSGLPLSAMSVSDSVTLLAQLGQALFHSMPKGDVGDNTLDAICKTDIYLMHTTSAFSVWCWLALSILRYTAVFHPIKYRTIWRQPRNALKALAVLCCVFEVWILFFVVYSPDGKICAEDSQIPERHVKLAHLMDICMFYAVPSLLRIFFDGVVLFHCYNPFSVMDAPLFERRYAISVPVNHRRISTSTECEPLDLRNNMALVMSISTNAVISKKRQTFLKKKTAMVMRSIIISALNLYVTTQHDRLSPSIFSSKSKVLNLPAHILRTWLTIDETAGENDAIPVLEPISQILYFSQFACNAFYLSTSIYESVGTPRSTVVLNHGRQVSRCISNDEDT